MHKKKVIIIGSGFGWLWTAILMARKWYEVVVYEKNECLGGRASVFEAEGFRRDMGPSWYLMPDVFVKFFDAIGEKVEDYLDLKKLDPSYRIWFDHHGKDPKVVDIHAELEKDLTTFEDLEPGVTDNFKEYLRLSKYQYEIAMDQFVYKNYDSWLDFFSWDMFVKSLKLKVFSKMADYVKRFFKSDAMQKIVQYPLLFLGTSPFEAPAIYNIMSHVDFNMGVFYPQGGIYEIIKSLVKIAEKNGVVFHTHSEVEKILIDQAKITGIRLGNGKEVSADIVISNADLHFTETQLVDEEYQTYPASYWKEKDLAPSAFIIYLGMKDTIAEFTHHNLIFTQDWKKNFDEIFHFPQLPDDPSMYICAPSKTDPTVAPIGQENLFILVPIAPGIQINEHQKEHYTNKIYHMIEQICDVKNFKDRIQYERIFHVKDFEHRYHAYKGTALGLAHTMFQTAILRPNNISKKVKNLYYVGAFTNPGIGMPMCLISAQLVASRFTSLRS